MIIIIDGYNVIRQIHHGQSAHAKQGFVKRLVEYSRVKKHQIYLVFDGGDHPYEYHERYNNVQVTHSGYKQTADDVIKKLLAQINGQEALLVSSDRELVDAARRYSIDSCDARTFYQLLQEKGDKVAQSIPSHKAKDIVKLSTDQNDELAQLMEESTRSVPQKPDDAARLRKREGHVLSKQEKRLLRKVKKL